MIDEAQGGSMRDRYDNPNLEGILEEQRDRLPKGPLGHLEPTEIEISGDRPREAVALLDSYLAGKIGTMEFAPEMEKIRLRVATGPSL